MSGYVVPVVKPAPTVVPPVTNTAVASADVAAAAVATSAVMVVPDGQKVVCNVSVAVGSDQLIVSQPIFAAADVDIGSLPIWTAPASLPAGGSARFTKFPTAWEYCGP